jgi:hypothetical protein
MITARISLVSSVTEASILNDYWDDNPDATYASVADDFGLFI